MFISCLPRTSFARALQLVIKYLYKTTGSKMFVANVTSKMNSFMLGKGKIDGFRSNATKVDN